MSHLELQRRAAAQGEGEAAKWREGGARECEEEDDTEKNPRFVLKGDFLMISDEGEEGEEGEEKKA